MRNAVQVRITREQFLALNQLFDTASHNLQSRLRLFVENARENLTDTEEKEAQEIIQAARELYENDDVVVDDDAALSKTDVGVWVSGWLWVAKKEDE